METEPMKNNFKILLSVFSQCLDHVSYRRTHIINIYNLSTHLSLLLNPASFIQAIIDE